MKRLLPLFAAIVALPAMAADPAATITSVAQRDDESVVVAYDLANEPAVVTLEVLQGGVRLDDAATWCVHGDVNRRVDPGSGREIVWHPDISWPGHKASETSLSFRLVAWPTNDTPPYLVVDLAANSSERIRYYTSTNALPGGLLANKDYRTTKMVFRRIPAKGVTWNMGPDGAQHEVTLDHDYYIGVFELTAGQHYTVLKENNAPGYFSGVEWKMRAIDNRMIYQKIRGGSGYWPPDPPKSDLFLAKVRDLTGGEIDLDLPGEAEWEFACRAGYDNAHWGDGSAVSIVNNVDDNLSRIARYAKHDGLIGGTLNPYNSINYQTGPTNGVAIVGSYAPNAFGLYDMHGNVREYCLDAWQADITQEGGAVIGGTSATRVIRGGGYGDNPSSCLSGARSSANGTSAAGGGYGVRLACRAGLQ